MGAEFAKPTLGLVEILNLKKSIITNLTLFIWLLQIKLAENLNTQVPTRWIDQGADKAIILAETPNRYLAGVTEVALKFLFDKTNWRSMLRNIEDESIDSLMKNGIVMTITLDLQQYFVEDDDVLELNYPFTNSQKKSLP